MQLGTHLRELWRLRIGLTLSVLFALVVAVWSVAKIGLLPPRLEPRELEMAAASTHVLVDAPKSSVIDLSVDTYDFEAITNRALLVGNVMASTPVRQYIARSARVSPEVLQVENPVTPDFPRPLAVNGKKRSSDILKSPDEYRLSISVNPTVPVLDVAAEASSAEAAARLANGAIDGMKDYLRDLAASEAVPPERQVHLEQLGRASGDVLNRGVSIKVAALTFMLVFAASAATVLFLARVRRGWIAERRHERGEPWPPFLPSERG